MNYMFTAILIALLCVMAIFMEPAYPRNEYLNDGTNTCSTGSFDISVEQRDYESRYRHYDPTNNYSSPSDDQSIRLTWRKYLGSACTKEFRDYRKNYYKVFNSYPSEISILAYDAVGLIYYVWKKNGKINSVNDFSFKGKIKGKIGTFSFENKQVTQDLNIYKAENNKFTKF